MFDKNPEEHYIKEGDPKKPTYYIIRRMNENTDLADMYLMVMGHVWYALSKGWLPVVDMQNYPNLYLSPEKLGKENSWEYYFEQPFRVGLEQAYKEENVVLSDGDCVKPYPDSSMNLLQKKDETFIEWQMLLKMNFMKIKAELTEEISTMREKIFMPEDNVLGVLLHDEDYSDKKAKGDPNIPFVEFAANTIRKKFKSWACTKVLLVTKNQFVAELFRNNFADKCILLDQIFDVYYNTEKEDEYFLRGKKCLMQTVLLSECNSFIADRCAEATITMLTAEKFDHTQFFDLGD